MLNHKLIVSENHLYLADHVVGFNKNFGYYPPNDRQIFKNKIIILDNLEKEIDNKSIICSRGDVLRYFDLFIKKMKFMKNNFILLFCVSVVPFEEEHLKIFSEITKLKRIYYHNMNVVHEKCKFFPLGLPFSKSHPNNKVSIFEKYIDKKMEKNNLINFYFTISTRSHERNLCKKELESKGYKFEKEKKYETYLHDLKSSMFCISPRGNGIDCFRHWESLYMKTIPVVNKSVSMEYYKNLNLPIILVEDNKWVDLDFEKLKNQYETFNWDNVQEILNYQTWKNEILDFVKNGMLCDNNRSIE